MAWYDPLLDFECPFCRRGSADWTLEIERRIIPGHASLLPLFGQRCGSIRNTACQQSDLRTLPNFRPDFPPIRNSFSTAHFSAHFAVKSRQAGLRQPQFVSLMMA